MRVIIDLTSLDDNFSGIERFALNIAKNIIEDRTNEYVLIFKNKIYKDFEKEEYRGIEKIIINGGKKLIFNQIKLPMKLYKLKADRYLFLAFPSPILFRRKGIINTIHDLTCWDYPETMKFLSRNYFKISILNAVSISEKIITVSNFSKNRIQNKFKFKDIHVINNGVSDVFLEEKSLEYEKNVLLKLNLEAEYIMALGTLEPRKNLKLLIQAFRELVIDGNFKYKLVLVGRKGWKMDDFLKDIEEVVKEKIIFTGFIEDEYLPVIYKKAKLFIFPSLYEGFGIPLIEAMQMKTLALVSDIDVFREVAEETALYFKNNDINDLKRKIIKSIELTEAERGKMLKLGYENSQRFRWKLEADKLIEEVL